MPRPEGLTLTLDRIDTPLGEVLVVTDADGAVRALDFADYHLKRQAPGLSLFLVRQACLPAIRCKS